jgi:hypothetical protein
MMDRVKITEPTESTAIIRWRDEGGCFRKYEVHQDPVTGDWSVFSESDLRIQGQWLLSKSGAINFVLERIGVSPNGEYERAPDRTSA